MKKKKDFITKKIKIPKGYKTTELVSDDYSGVLVFDKKKKRSGKSDPKRIPKKMD